MNEPRPPAAAPAAPITEQLKAERIQMMLRDVPTWQLAPTGDELLRTWTVPSLFAGAAFAGALAAVVEHHEHEATITVTPGCVAVSLSTPAAGGLTAKDFEVASALEFRT